MQPLKGKISRFNIRDALSYTYIPTFSTKFEMFIVVPI